MSVIAVYGAGLLGSGFVENLLNKGHTVRVWNRTASKVGPLVAKGAVACGSPAEAALGAERVHLVLAEDPAVDVVIDAAAPAIAAGVPIVDHSTNQPDRVAARFAALRASGLRYLHAPVFMSPVNARDGAGLMLIAGPAVDVEALMPALSEMTGRVWHVGERPDLAAVHKLNGNAVLIGLAGVLGDVLAIGAAQGLSAADTMSLFDVFKPGAVLPWIGGRVAKAGESPPSFELTMARKDVRLMIASAKGLRITALPAVAAAMDDALAEGRGAQDFAVFARHDR